MIPVNGSAGWDILLRVRGTGIEAATTVERERILKTLAQHQGEIAARFGVRRLALFGSAARDQLRPDSDVDLLVEFNGPATFRGYFELKDYLEQVLGRAVDLVTEKGLKPRARPYVERDLIRVA